MKRITREMPDEQKYLISRSLRGRCLTPSHKANISQALRRYWSTIPKQADENGEDKSYTDFHKKNGKLIRKNGGTECEKHE